MPKTLIEKMEAKGSPRSWINEVSTTIAKIVTLKLRVAEYGEIIDTLAQEKESLEISLAEYENDETARRREDALTIRTLERRLEMAAEMAFTSELVDSDMLQSELLEVAGTSEEEFKSDWIKGWIEGLTEEKANGNET